MCEHVKEHTADVKDSFPEKNDGKPEKRSPKAPDTWFTLLNPLVRQNHWPVRQCYTGRSRLRRRGGLKGMSRLCNKLYISMISCSDTGGKCNIRAAHTGMFAPLGVRFWALLSLPPVNCDSRFFFFVWLADVLAYFQRRALAHLPAPQAMPP